MAMIGRKAHIARLKRLQGPEMDRRVGRALFAGGNIVQVDAQLSLTAGAVSGKNHVPSLPGQPPNQDTGVLGNNIETVLLFDEKGPYVEVTSNAPYSRALEEGTSRMAARPFMQPALDRNRDKVTDLVLKAVQALARKR
jgi:HK97 gp10 family phage protein